jgi:4-amino-4-deoxy-L-arabinose transferase-like glycosyltransferase
VSAVDAQTQVPATRRGAGVRRLPRFWAALLGIAGAGVVIRVLYTLFEAPWPPPGLDDQFYFSALPKLIADGEGFIRPFVYAFKGGQTLPTAEHPPFYSVVLAGLAELGGRSPDAQRLAGAAFGAGTIVAVGLIGRRLAGARAGLIAAGLAAVYPVLIAADGALMSESLLGLLAGLSLLAALRLVERPTTGRALALGVALGLAALTRSEGLLLRPLLLVPVLRRPRGVRAAVVTVVACVVVLTPWTVRNWIVFDQPVLISTNSGSAVGGANCHSTYYGDKLGGWDPACLPDNPGEEAEHMASLRRRGIEYARDHGERLPVVLGVRLARVWNVYDVLQVPEGRSIRVHKLGVAMFFVLVPLAVAGALVLRRRGVSLWIPLVPFAVVSLTALAAYGNQRFREVAELSLVVLAAVALDAFLRRRESVARRPAEVRA